MITTAATDPAFVAHAAEFDQVLGPAPRLSLLTELDALMDRGRVSDRVIGHRVREEHGLVTSRFTKGVGSSPTPPSSTKSSALPHGSARLYPGAGDARQ